MKKAQQDIDTLKKSANELKNIKKHQQTQNLMQLKRREEDGEAARRENAKRAELQELWRRIQEQEKLLATPLDTANSLKLSLQKALRKMVESFKHTLNLRMLICSIELNRHDMTETLKLDGVLVEDFDVSQKNFNRHFEDCYQKLNFESRSTKRQKLTKAQTLTELGENQDYNENSFLMKQYEKEKLEYEKRMREKLYGKKKKRSKIPLKERRRIRFFNSLHRRGLNPDQESSQKTNVIYTQVSKQISNYQKSENKHINHIVKEFDEATRKISSASGGVVLNKKWS